jgi:hypothetical protein
MPELNGMKFPYTPKGKKRYQEIKEALKKKKGKKKPPPKKGKKKVKKAKPVSDEQYFVG